MSKLKLVNNLLVLFLCSLLTACFYPPITEDAAISTDYTYLIGPGDSVDIYVWGNPDVSRVVTVRPDGKVTVPLVEDLQASGKTAYELARKLEEAYAQYIRDPQVVVMVASFQGVDQQQIRVIGQVGNSGGDQGSNRYSGDRIPY